jgi:phospholipid/cholesterol/gamma-HCH transport system substrate-binding protein
MTRVAAIRRSRRRGVVGLAVAAGIALLTYVAFVLPTGLPLTKPYTVHTVVPADAPVIKRGDEVRVAGHRVGRVTKVTAARAGRRLELDIASGAIGRAASATVEVRGLAGPNFVALRAGDRSDPLPSGATIPGAVADEDLASVAGQFRDDTLRALAGTLSGYGAGLAGEGPNLNRLIEDLAPATRDITPVLRALRGRPGDLTAIVGSLDRVLRAFAPPSGALDGFVTGADGTFGAMGRAASRLAGALEAAPQFESQLAHTAPVATPLLEHAARLGRDLEPGIRALNAALPDVNAVLARGHGLDALAELARKALPVVRDARPVLLRLAGPAASLRPLAAALGGIADYTNPYGGDIVQSLEYLKSWSGNRYQDGQARGAYAVRFTPVFTCHKPRNPYPSPGQATRDAAPGC